MGNKNTERQKKRKRKRSGEARRRQEAARLQRRMDEAADLGLTLKEYQTLRKARRDEQGSVLVPERSVAEIRNLMAQRAAASYRRGFRYGEFI